MSLFKKLNTQPIDRSHKNGCLDYGCYNPSDYDFGDYLTIPPKVCCWELRLSLAEDTAYPVLGFPTLAMSHNVVARSCDVEYLRLYKEELCYCLIGDCPLEIIQTGECEECPNCGCDPCNDCYYESYSETEEL